MVVVILFSAFIVDSGCTFLAMGFLEAGAIRSSFTDPDFVAVGDAVYLADLIAVVYSVFCKESKTKSIGSWDTFHFDVLIYI